MALRRPIARIRHPDAQFHPTDLAGVGSIGHTVLLCRCGQRHLTAKTTVPSTANRAIATVTEAEFQAQRAWTSTHRLSIESGVGRAALYSTYLHLKEGFEQRCDQLRAAGAITDSREAQIVRLKEQIDNLKARVTEQDREIAEHAALRIQAVSQLAAQHDEIGRLWSALAEPANVPQPPRSIT